MDNDVNQAITTAAAIFGAGYLIYYFIRSAINR